MSGFQTGGAPSTARPNNEKVAQIHAKETPNAAKLPIPSVAVIAQLRSGWVAALSMPRPTNTRPLDWPIDPKVHCVPKTLFGSVDHRDLRLTLNALLAGDLAAPLAVDILNPSNERETLDDKLTVVDLKARDGRSLVDHDLRVEEIHVEPVESDAERWLNLKDGETLHLTALPGCSSTTARSAMSTLNAFSEKERDYHRYQSRQEALSTTRRRLR